MVGVFAAVAAVAVVFAGVAAVVVSLALAADVDVDGAVATAVLVYVCIDFGFWRKIFGFEDEAERIWRASGEAILAATVTQGTSSSWVGKFQRGSSSGSSEARPFSSSARG